MQLIYEERLTTFNMDSQNVEDMKLNSLQCKLKLTQKSIFALFVVPCLKRYCFHETF